MIVEYWNFIQNMKCKKYISSLLFLVLITNLNSQVIEKSKPISLFWGLIKIDKGADYVGQTWFDKWFRSREFSAPITFMPVEMRYGIGFTGKTSESSSFENLDNWIIYKDENVTPLEQKAENIVGAGFDIDVLMINIPHIIMNTSWMNLLTGFNYRSSSIFSPSSIPDDWKANSPISGNDIKFKPELKEYLITNNLQWQPFNKWYVNFKYGYGLATAKFYYDNDLEILNPSPSGSGTSMALGFGIRFIIDSGKLNRFSIGVDIRHSYTKINNISDQDNVFPVNRFDLSNYGIYLTLSTFYGGKVTTGDIAKRTFYRRDFITSKSQFIDFINQYPNHSNKYRALSYIDKCNEKIPYQIMDQGLFLDDKGNTKDALKKYLDAKSRIINKDTLLNKSLDFRINEIARNWMNSAELLLEKELYKDALSLVTNVASFSELGEKQINRFKSYVILGEGKKLQSILIIGKAMEKYSKALELNNELESKIKALHYQAGIQLVELANDVDEFDEIMLAVKSLEQAKTFSKSLGDRNEKLLKDLKVKLEKLDNYKINANIDREMSKARYLQAIARSPRLTIGMSLPLIKDLLGSPHEKIVNDIVNQSEQMWIYHLNNKQLHLSFKDFILFKIDEY